MAIQKTHRYTPKTLQNRIDKYYSWAEKQGKPLTIASLAHFLGIDRRTLFNFRKEDDKDLYPIVQKALAYIVADLEEKLITSRNPVGLIFLMKNYGYTDKQEIENISRGTINVDIKRLTDSDLEMEIKRLGESEILEIAPIEGS